MKITANYIKTFNPCKDGIGNFEDHYPNFEGKLSDLLSLENVSYSDKIWLATKIVDVKILQIWSISCAESVLPIFEKYNSNDTRVRDCIETVKKVINGELPSLAAESAAMLARSAESATRSEKSAVWSAESAARSAESVTLSEKSAVWSAESAALSARSAVWSAESEKEQEDLNLLILIALLKNKGM